MMRHLVFVGHRLPVACTALAFFLAIAIGSEARAGLVAQWKFDDNGGTNAVSATNSPADDGTLNGTIGFSNGDLAPIAGNVSVLDSDGSTGNYVSTAFAGITGTDARTVSAWVKTTNNTGGSTGGFGIVSWGPDLPSARFGIRLHNGVIRIEHNSSKGFGSINVATGEWRHIAITSAAGNDDLSAVKIYVDGILDTNSASLGSGMNTQAGTFEIGGLNLFGNNWPEGLIDDVRVYNTALSASDIADLAQRVPEPSSILLGLLGATGVALCRRKVRLG